MPRASLHHPGAGWGTAHLYSMPGFCTLLQAEWYGRRFTQSDLTVRAREAIGPVYCRRCPGITGTLCYPPRPPGARVSPAAQIFQTGVVYDMSSWSPESMCFISKRKRSANSAALRSAAVSQKPEVSTAVYLFLPQFFSLNQNPPAGLSPKSHSSMDSSKGMSFWPPSVLHRASSRPGLIAEWEPPRTCT